MTRFASFLLSLAAIALVLPGAAAARPEKIRPGHSYYSDDQVVTGRVRDIADEKNYEEVYQAYRYYEAVYDEDERVVVFKEYVRGAVVRTEEYHYGSEGQLTALVIREAGRPPETLRLDAASGAVDASGGKR